MDEKEPIRIFVDLTAIEADFGNRENERSYLRLDDVKSAVDEVKETLEKLIKVKPLTQLRISKNLGDYGFIDTQHYNESLTKEPGIKADLIILIRYSKSDDGMTAKKFAKPEIIQKNDDNRPVVGIVKLYPTYGLPENEDVNKKEYLKYLFLHEFTHILGFFSRV